MKDLGEAEQFLGMNIKINHNKRKIKIQKDYIEDMLRKFNMIDCKPVSTSADSNIKLNVEMCPKGSKEIEYI